MTTTTPLNRKTSIYLPNDLRAQVRAIAAETGMPASEIYRRAIRDYAQAKPFHRDPRNDLALIRRALESTTGTVSKVSEQLAAILRDPETGAAVEILAVRHQSTGKLSLVSASIVGQGGGEYPIERVMTKSAQAAFIEAMEAAERKRNRRK